MRRGGEAAALGPTALGVQLVGDRLEGECAAEVVSHLGSVARHPRGGLVEEAVAPGPQPLAGAVEDFDGAFVVFVAGGDVLIDAPDREVGARTAIEVAGGERPAE